MTTPPTPHPLTPARRAEIKQRAEAATPGPWFSCNAKYGPAITSGAPGNDQWQPGDDGWPEDAEAVVSNSCDGEPCISKADRAFIAAARADIPALLAALDEATKREARLIAAVEEAKETFHMLGKVDQSTRWDHLYESMREAMKESAAASPGSGGQEGQDNG